MPLSSSDPAIDPAPRFARHSGSAPVVTIGIPCYNRPALLAEALASIAAQQGGTPCEVVISDDGADPETRRVVEHSGVRDLRFYVNQPALGPVANWNRCIDLARTDWATILHEDDLLFPWFLATVTPRLRPGVAAVSVRCVQGPTPPARPPAPGPESPRPYAPVWFLKGAMTPFPGVVFSRAVARQVGGFDARLGGLADYAFWYALACHGGIETFRGASAFYRVNEGQWTERAWPQMLRTAHLLRLRIAREQLPNSPRLGRWIARFYTARMARAYRGRFTGRPAALTRAQRFERIPLGGVSSGWVWALLKRLG